MLQLWHIHIWPMKSNFSLHVGPFTDERFSAVYISLMGLINPSAGFVIPKRSSIIPIMGFLPPIWSPFNPQRNFSFDKRRSQSSICSMDFRQVPSVDIQLKSIFPNISCSQIDTYFESYGILRKLVLKFIAKVRI